MAYRAFSYINGSSFKLNGREYIFTAETVAILKALRYAEGTEVEDLVMMSDTMSVLMAIQSKMNNTLVNKIIGQVA